MAASFVPLLVAFFAGCTKPPVYSGITSVVVHHQTTQGTAKQQLRGEDLERAVACLERTTEVSFDSEQSAEEPLQAIILLQVVDRNGDRMFELLTGSVFKGNKGKYYRNDCILPLVRQAE